MGQTDNNFDVEEHTIVDTASVVDMVWVVDQQGLQRLVVDNHWELLR